MSRYWSLIFISALWLLGLSASQAVEPNVLLKPFTMAQKYPTTSYDTVVKEIPKRLQAAGFSIIGRYQPYANTLVLVLTSNELKNLATKTRYGGFGAAIRVSIVNNGKEVQVAHNNPSYLGIAYNMDTDMSSIRGLLAKTLGYVKDYGGEGVPAGDLPTYNYAMGLEKFNGFFELASYKSQAEALASVEKGFTNKKLNITRVYRLDIPGKSQTVYGLAMQGNKDDSDQKYINDEFVMGVIDHTEERRAAHLPYELMVTDGRVIAMHPHYRLAVNFTDLKMFGQNSFGRLMDLPYVYEEYLVQLAGGQWPRRESSY